jgi:hypothetical protein
MTPARKSRSLIGARAVARAGGGREGGREGGMDGALRPISGLPNIDRAFARHAISPRLGAFRGPLIAAITVIIDLLRGLSHQAAISGPRDPRARVAGISLAAEAASGRRLRRHGVKRAVQWVIQSVGRVAKGPPAALKRDSFDGAGARAREALVIYTPLRRNAANLAQQVDTAICGRVLYRARGSLNNN